MLWGKKVLFYLTQPGVISVFFFLNENLMQVGLPYPLNAAVPQGPSNSGTQTISFLEL